MVAGLAGMRVAVRLIRGRRPRTPLKSTTPSPVEHVLVVGLNPVTELYLRSVRSFATGRIAVAGILAEGLPLKGRVIQFHKILGTPEELRAVLRDQEVHGIAVNRIVVTEPFEALSEEAREALLWAEKARDITLDFFGERLGLFEPAAAPGTAPGAPAANGDGRPANGDGNDAGKDGVPGRALDGLVPALAPNDPAGGGDQRAFVSAYGAGRLKRLVDFVAAGASILLLAPLLALLSGLVALGLGLPLTFWQSRPGRFGRPFRLYKFRSFRPPHDEAGRPLSEAERETAVGRLLRRFRLDELPQLYNILVGEMSFVGPRPLLPVDQPPVEALGGTSEARLAVRPGLTGWAQVNGGRDMSAEDKMVLDLWYVQNASLALDIRILWRTLLMVLLGERMNGRAVHEAWAGLGLKRPITLPHLAVEPEPARASVPAVEPLPEPGPEGVAVAPVPAGTAMAHHPSGREAA